MSKPVYKPLQEKYIQIAERFEGEMSTSDVPEAAPKVVIPTPAEAPIVAITWKDVGLFEPESEEDVKKCEKATKEIESLFDKFETELESWQKKYQELGALDTVAREQIAQFVAKSIFGLKRID